jgi:hypothetical protein
MKRGFPNARICRMSKPAASDRNWAGSAALFALTTQVMRGPARE